MIIVPACLINVDFPPIFGPVIKTQLESSSSLSCKQKKNAKFISVFCKNIISSRKLTR